MDDILYQVFDIAHSASSYTSSIATTLYTTFSPFREYIHSQPDLMNIALLLLIIYLSLSILGMASRWIYGVLVTTVRLLLILFVIAAAAWVFQRGSAAKGDLERLAELVGKAVGRSGQEWAPKQTGGREWVGRYNHEF